MTLSQGLVVVSLASLLQLGSQVGQYKVKYKEPPFLKGGMLSPTIFKMLGVGGHGCWSGTMEAAWITEKRERTHVTCLHSTLPSPSHLSSLIPLKSDGDDAMPSPR